MPNIVKGDTVMLRRGKEKGKRGIVKHVFPKNGCATVEGINAHIAFVNQAGPLLAQTTAQTTTALTTFQIP